MATKVQKQNETRKINKLRYVEYYGQQPTLDKLFADSENGRIFKNLMPLILSQENILQAYRTIKSNTGSHTPGTDKLNIEDIEKLDADELCAEIRRRLKNYQPKAVRRKEIPKPNGKTRPLGIPCIWDRLIQQCILQIMEPICEAKFSDHSYGFRPLRSAENAITAEMKLINLSKLHYVVEVDIKSFFDEVNHPKLMRQIWAMGIRDKKLLCIIRAILKAPIKMPDGATIRPEKGTPQGGILSPLLANIVLNELDHWIDSQWQENPVTNKYSIKQEADGHFNKTNGYTAMKKTNLKEMRIIRYADDVRIFCRTKDQANRTAIAVKQWLNNRLKLQVSEEKTRVVNLKKQYSEFLGFKLKVKNKAKKWVVQSHICDKAKTKIKAEAKEQIKRIQRPADSGEQAKEICNYNAKVRGWHNYYEIATNVNLDFKEIAWDINHTIRSRLKTDISKIGNMGKKSKDYSKYGKSKEIRYINGQWILPLAYVQHKNPISKKRAANIYTIEGRALVHKELEIQGLAIMKQMAKNPVLKRSVEYNDNRISLFAAQYGRCSVTGLPFLSTDEVHCHHIKPTNMGGSDKYQNLTLVRDDIHRLIHATCQETIQTYMQKLRLNPEQVTKLNNFRCKVGCEPVR